MPDACSSVLRKIALLCMCPKAPDPVLDGVLQRFDASVVHDARAACRKARLGIYNVYLACDPLAARGPLQLLEALRSFDANTPCVLLCGAGPSLDAQVYMRPEFETAMPYPGSSGEVLRAVHRLIEAGEHRSLTARAEEARVIAEEINERLSELGERVNLSRQSLARAQEHVMRAHALRVFAGLGGTRASFEKYWPETFEAALRATYRDGEI